MKKNKPKSKKFKFSKRTWIILILLIAIIFATFYVISYFNSQKYMEKRIENKLIKLATEYYEDKLISVASGYIVKKAEAGETIKINLAALKDYGKDVSFIKNEKNGKVANEIDSYVEIKVDKNAENISKDYEVVNVVIDCFD